MITAGVRRWPSVWTSACPISQILDITDDTLTFWTSGFFGTNGVIYRIAT
jgi:hypothetical protein